MCICQCIKLTSPRLSAVGVQHYRVFCRSPTFPTVVTLFSNKNKTPGYHILNLLSVCSSAFLLASEDLLTLFGLSIPYTTVVFPHCNVDDFILPRLWHMNHTMLPLHRSVLFHQPVLLHLIQNEVHIKFKHTISDFLWEWLCQCMFPFVAYLFSLKLTCTRYSTF